MSQYLSNNGFDEKPPLLERLCDKTCNWLTLLHTFIAKVLMAVFSFLWRVQGRTPLPMRFAVGSLLMAASSAFVAIMLPLSLPVSEGPIAKIVKGWPSLYLRWNDWAETNAAFIRYLENGGKISSGTLLAILAVLSVVLLVFCFFAAWFRRKRNLWLLKTAWALHAVVLIAFTNWTISVPKVLFAADSKNFDDFACKELWTYTIFTAPLAWIVPVLVFVALLTLEARRFYEGEKAEEKLYDSNRFILSIKTGGDDPRFRSSCYWAVALFVFALIGPFLINGCGTEEYGMPKGSGEPEAEVVVIKKKPKKKPKKKLLIDPWSPYILERMDIDDAKVLEELEETTQDTYQADRTSKSGKLGKGGKGKGGWPKGMEGEKVRFIRLKYNGGNWDQEMGKQGDYNLLVRFNQLTGLPVAAETEAREIERIARFAKKKAPPFLFMTGSGNINISSGEAKILRNYCENEGGMLFIDCGGGRFGQSVRNMLHKIFPGKTLVDIPNDDPIYQLPFAFPDGAPRFWHHDGNRALAIRHEGRIVAFYHPGDVKDAWKDGHSGAKPEVAEQAYKLGVNVIYYAFNNYYKRHYEQDEK